MLACRHYQWFSYFSLLLHNKQKRHKNNIPMLLMPRLLTANHPARSNRHHLQQPHKEPTPQSRSYWSTRHSTHGKIEPTCNQIHNKHHTDETRQLTQPPKYLSNIFGANNGVQASASQPPDPHWKAHLIFILQMRCCVSASIGWCRTQTNIFPNPCRQCLTYLRSCFFLFCDEAFAIAWC